jgi:hypothetical protein
LQARSDFHRWQSTSYLAPSGLLPSGYRALCAVLLPFWLFEVAAEVDASGKVGTTSAGSQGQMAWRHTGWQHMGSRSYPISQPETQVYASFNHRRDHAAVAKCSGDDLASARPLAPTEVEEGSVQVGHKERVELDPVTMQQSLAWEFALHAIREREVAAAQAWLRERYDARTVEDVQVKVRATYRKAILAFFPAYEAKYVYGMAFNVHGERKPHKFRAMISGTGPARIAGERHLSPWRSAAAAAAAAAATMVAADITGTGVGAGPWALLTTSSAFYPLVWGALGMLGAQMTPALLQQAAEDRRVRAEHAEFERAASAGLGPLDTGREGEEVLRSAAEWRRWEESELTDWKEDRRRRWAQDLWRAQRSRRLDRRRFASRMEVEAKRQRTEDERERRRRERWGHSSYFQRHPQHPNTFAGGRRAGGHLDPKGYYRSLGLDPGGETHISQEEIKKAFRRAAMRWHPDRHHSPAASGRAAWLEAREKFQQARAAYDVLRDPEVRRKYDRGER